MNRATILGHVGSNPEVRYTGNGTAVANIRIATNEKWKDKAGVEQERTEWHSVIAWAKLAELIGENVTKGQEILVEGRLQTREWTNKDGVVGKTTEIVADSARWFAKRERKNAAPAPGDQHVPPAGRREQISPPPGLDTRPAAPAPQNEDIPF